MPESDSPPVRRDRMTALVAIALVCVVLPTVVILVSDSARGSAHAALAWLGGSAAVGCLLSLLYWAPYRALGLVPYAAVAWLVGVLYAVLAERWPGWLMGLPLGVIIGGFVRGRRGPEPGEENPALVGAVLLGAGIAWGFIVAEPPYDLAGYFVLAAALALVVWAWSRLFRPVFEITCEPLVWVMYAIRGRGPGLANVPRTGPCLIIANHACWLDPLFLAKVIPRPITPMMTAAFYDLPVMRRLMVAFGVIRVPEKAMKKQTPEIDAALAALDRGECVVIFPEGYLRRTEERPLRRFGQGVWQILQARPDTPVFACWIEGAWGSYMSYYNGRPTKNKKRDFRRPIAIAVSEPITVPAEVRADHMRTRLHLMNLVAAARAHLGLPALPPFELPAKGEEKADEPPENGE
jgi:1-acyl-sn-glycerol-3-phosphate acyltransferase